MVVATALLGNEGLMSPSNRVMVSGSIADLAYPPICPNCGADARRPLLIAKPFMFSSGDDSGWSHRVAEARPLFCEPCHTRHVSEVLPVTVADRLKSLLSQSLLFSALGLGAFGGLIAVNRAVQFMTDPAGEWPIIALAGVMLMTGWYCAQIAWREGLWARIPVLTATSAAFDFGDDDGSAFQKTARTYAIRNAACASAFEKINAKR